MGASSGLMAASFVQAGTAASSAVAQAGAAKAQGAYESKQADTNAKLAEIQAADAKTRGDVAAQEKAKQDAQLMGSQRAGLAASGVALDKGSAADIQKDTLALSELDQLTIRNNAAREAFGFQTQASNYRSQGDMADLAAKNTARNTILTGGMNALSFTAKGYTAYKKSVGDKNNIKVDRSSDDDIDWDFE